MRLGDYFETRAWGMQLAVVIKSPAEAIELVRKIEDESRRLWHEPPPTFSYEGRGGYYGYTPPDQR